MESVSTAGVQLATLFYDHQQCLMSGFIGIWPSFMATTQQHCSTNRQGSHTHTN